jgi:AcrR family transcriptional regulator
VPRQKQTRAYDGAARREGAAETRRAILVAARELFIARGYAATTMPAIAAAAEVAQDTVYASVGKKPALFRLLVETAISGTDAPVPALQREYVKAIIAEPDPRRKLTIYARAVATIMARVAPLFRVLRQAADSDEDLAQMWREISVRRARNMRDLARDLAATGALREDLTLDEVADVVWSTSSPDVYSLMVGERGWTNDRFAQWLADAWHRLLLR